MDQRKPVQMESLQSWFRREVYQWRVGASIVWTVLTIPPVVSLYFLLACFSPLHPVQWMIDFLSGLTSLAFWASMATLMCVVGGISVYNSAHFVVVPDIPLNRAAAIASLFRIPCVIHSAVFSLAGGVIIWCFSGLIGAQYDRLAEHCSEESEKYCLNEHHLLMILQGVAVGVMSHLQYWLRHDNYITFPVLQQAKFFTVKSNIWSILSRSFYFELYFIKYFYLAYFILGHIPRNWILRNMNIESRDVQPLNTIFGLLDLGLLWEITLSGMFVHFLFTYSAFLYKVYISEPYVFPIENVYEESRNKCLHNALGCADFPLVKRLGYLDLSLLSRHSTGRRGQLFTLSQPGGHPHNWNSVYRACLTEVDALSHSLQENNWKTFAPLRHSSGENSANGVTEVGPNQPSQPNTQVDPWAKMVSNLKTRPVFGYFLSELPEAAARRVFAASQTQIWAIEALSALVAASFTEDPYGVVQRSMPEILASLLNLQENVEKHFKLAPVVSRRSQSALDVGLRHALRTTLKMSLYRIINTFGSHLSELKLTPEHSKRLKFFMDYRE